MQQCERESCSYNIQLFKLVTCIKLQVIAKFAGSLQVPSKFFKMYIVTTFLPCTLHFLQVSCPFPNMTVVVIKNKKLLTCRHISSLSYQHKNLSIEIWSCPLLQCLKGDKGNLLLWGVSVKSSPPLFLQMMNYKKSYCHTFM